jgi:hypothetical protein
MLFLFEIKNKVFVVYIIIFYSLIESKTKIIFEIVEYYIRQMSILPLKRF